MDQKSYIQTIVVAGSRPLNLPLHKDKIWAWLYKHIKDPTLTLFLFGDAEGPDTFMHQWCDLHKYPHEDPYVPIWALYGHAAGIVRNTQLLRDAQKTPRPKVIVFWDGVSPGSKNMIKQATEFNLPVTVLTWHPTMKTFIQKQKRLFE